MASNLILSGADDPSTMSFADTTPTAAASNEAQQYAAQWDAAQQRYRAGLNAGYSEDEADALYLAPVKNKWDVLKDVPDAMKPAAAKELDAANTAYVQGVDSGYQPTDAAKIFLKPAEEKWTAAADTVPKMQKASQAALETYYEKSPAIRSEQQEAQDELDNNVPVQQVRQNHPLLTTAPGVAPRWSAIFNAAEREQNTSAAATAAAAKEKATEDKASSPDTLLTQAAKVYKLQLPPDMESARNNQIAQLSAALPKPVEQATNESNTSASPSIRERLINYIDDLSTGQAAQPAAPEKPEIPKVGEIREGYKFTGGDPSQKKNWEAVD